MQAVNTYARMNSKQEVAGALPEKFSKFKPASLDLVKNQAPYPPTTSLLGLHVPEYRRLEMLRCTVEVQAILQLPFSRCECLEIALDIDL